MKYKHGFWTILGASALSVSLLAGCGEEDPATPPPGAGGTSGLAGNGGSGAGAGGSSAGAGGSKAGSGGSAGTGGTSAGTGGTSAGTGGTSGGSGGSSGGFNEAVENIGVECQDDVDCGPGGKCLAPSGTDLFDGAPPAGHCTIDCTAWLNLPDAEKETTPYPCDPDVNLSDPNANLQRLCLNVAEEGQPAKGYCFERCDFGQPEFEFLDKLDPDKCNGREDTVCFPLNDSKGIYTTGFCRPFCQSDDQCDSDLKCDKSTGVCRANVPTNKKKSGALCTRKLLPNGEVDTSAESECESGICSPIDDPLNPDRKDLGICIDICIIGSLESCGGPNSGLCIFFGRAETEDGTILTGGQNDLGLCAKTTPAKKDTDCPWQAGWFHRTFNSQIPAICLPSQECEVDNDCAFTCEQSDDCPEGNQCQCPPGKKCDCDPEKDKDCSPKQCFSNGQPNIGTLKCRAVPELCGKSFCIDHVPQGLPANDPLVDCSNVGGSGGAAGSGGGAGSGGASAGSGGASAGSGGASAGSGGAAAGNAGQAGGNLRSAPPGWRGVPLELRAILLFVC
ncbi:MAG: hypothetical protein RMJ98_00120 [Myxococcales bacterium]|nr:hypothetical protein [Polyangiaceae bacterium]MDW8247691.1 hypothetical protein [Myxococcales bacterium]